MPQIFQLCFCTNTNWKKCLVGYKREQYFYDPFIHSSSEPFIPSRTYSGTTGTRRGPSMGRRQHAAGHTRSQKHTLKTQNPKSTNYKSKEIVNKPNLCKQKICFLFLILIISITCVIYYYLSHYLFLECYNPYFFCRKSQAPSKTLDYVLLFLQFVIFLVLQQRFDSTPNSPLVLRFLIF